MECLHCTPTCRSDPFHVFARGWFASQSKALTIGKLMELVPAGTADPTPFIYDSTLYTMAGLMVSKNYPRVLPPIDRP